MKKLLAIVGGILGVLVIIVLVRALMMNPEKRQFPSIAAINLKTDSSGAHLAEALTYPTVSMQKASEVDTAAFSAFHHFLERTYPKMNTLLGKEVTNSQSLLYRWQGSDMTLKPALFMAHQDVVPVIPGTESEWIQPPFGGKIDSGFVWGRGALDDKSSLVGICEATEALLSQGFVPKRTIYFAFGHDEEATGTQGAAKMAEMLKGRGVQFEYVLDEGGTITTGLVPNVSAPVALIGISEKGYCSVELRVVSAGGHSSMPPKNTAVGILSKAISALEEHQIPARFDGVTGTFLERIGQESPFSRKLIFANMWLFKPLVEQMMSSSPTSNAIIRTTTAPTMLSGSVKENVLPIMATAVINFRIAPGDNVASVLEHVNATINDPRVKVRTIGTPSEPSPVSDVRSSSYQLLERSIIQVFGETHLIMPNLVVGATDARWFTGLSANVYRFSPSAITPTDLPRIHGTNERISIENFRQAVKFYYQLLRTTNEL